MELLLYVSISSAILLSIVFSMFLILESRVKNQVVAEVNQQGLQVMQILTQTIRNAEAITTPSYGLASSTLRLNTAVVALNPTVFFSNASGTFFIQEGAGGAIALTNSRVVISNITFQNTSSTTTSQGIVQISFTLTYNNQSSRGEYSYAKSFTGSASFIP